MTVTGEVTLEYLVSLLLSRIEELVCENERLARRLETQRSWTHDVEAQVARLGHQPVTRLVTVEEKVAEFERKEREAAAYRKEKDATVFDRIPSHEEMDRDARERMEYKLDMLLAKHREEAT